MPNSAGSEGTFSLASLQVQLTSSFPIIIFCLIITLVWGYLWSGVIRDEERQPLPSSFAAKMFFALSLCVIYMAIVVVGFMAPDILQKMNFPGMDNVIDAVRKQTPLLGIVTMGALYSVPQIKELGERYAVLLHNAQYRKNDEIVLQNHLQSCEFDPAQNEITLNIDYLRQFDVYVTGRDNTTLNLETVGAWRKASTLLRFLEEEARRGNSVLSAAEREQIDRLREAHRRKTQLAMNIIRMIDQLDINANVDQKLTRIASQLSDVSHSDRDKVVSAEEVARQILSQLDMKTGSAQIERPLRLSMRQMNEYLTQIERYFMTEYQLILRDVSKLAAKAIIRAGDRAADRLEAVKRMGFAGLGQIQRVSFDNVLWVLLTAFVVAFGGLTLFFATLGRPIPSFVPTLALTISIGALIGALWGSRRSLTERQMTPWSSYIAAGLIAVAAFCTIRGVSFLISGPEMLERSADRYASRIQSYIDLKIITPEAAKYYARESVLQWNFFDYIWQSLPWSLGVFFLVVGICWLARLPEWPWQRNNPVIERISDGVAVGLIYTLGGFASTIAHIALRTGSGLSYMERMAKSDSGAFWVLFGNTRILSLAIGFAIGAIIVREVRRIAHAKLIAQVGVRQPQSERAAPPREERLSISLDATKAS